MNDEAINWDDVPVVITKDQLYRICHINKYRPVPAPKREIPCEYTCLLYTSDAADD